MRRHTLLTSLTLLTLHYGTGCTITTDELGMSGNGTVGVATAAGSSESGATTGHAGTSAGPATDASGDSAASGETGSSGLTDGSSSDGGTTGPTGVLECSTWVQDCPEGENCTPWSWDDSGVLNATACRQMDVPFHDIGQACTLSTSPSPGTDTCGRHMMCVQDDPFVLEGTCWKHCFGSPEEPMCDPGYECTSPDGGLVNVCTELEPREP